MRPGEIIECLEMNPIIAAIRDDGWDAALHSPAQVLFYLSADLTTVSTRIRQAHEAGKILFVHIDLSEGIGRDRAGLAYLAARGVDGIISTRAQIIRLAKDVGLLTVQRFFALDSQGLDSIQEMLKTSHPHLMEIMPGVIPKVIGRFASGNIPVIAGGLIETKAEVTGALGCGAAAVSTGCEMLWYE
jgi:glycerol uptake operon antiterminator